MSTNTPSVVHTRTGFRKTEFGHGLVKLNDRVIQVHGYAQRSTNEWPAVGQEVQPWMSDFTNALMVESGGNVVRWLHVTPPKQEVESCDRVGLIEAMPAGDAEKDVEGRRWEQRVEVMREREHRSGENVVPCMRDHSGTKTAAKNRETAEERAIRGDRDHAGRSFIRVTAAEEQR